MNVAVTLLACVMDTVHVPVPVQAPLQPANIDPAAGDAVSVTDVPELYDALQVLPQLIPDGLDVTVPLPVPLRETLKENVVTVLNVAVTLRACVMDTVHVPVPVQAPLQPANIDPAAGDAVRVTDVPELYDALQVLPQLIPDGLDVTVPLPVPLRETLRENVVTVLTVTVRVSGPDAVCPALVAGPNTTVYDPAALPLGTVTV